MDSKAFISALTNAFGAKDNFATLYDSVDNSKSSIDNIASQSVAVCDAYGNSLTAVGTADRVQSFTTYGFDNSTLNWTLWMALYNDSWVFRRAIDKPAQDEVSCGFTIHGDLNYSPVYEEFDRNKTDITHVLQWGALFGGSIAVVMFDGLSDEVYAKPITREAVKGRRSRLYVTDRWYGVSPDMSNLVTNMKDVDYGKPRYYEVSFANGHSFRVHHSWVLRYEHRSAPRLIKCGQLQGWGYAEGAHILNELARDDQLKSSITSLVNKSLIEVIKMDGMRGVFMGADDPSNEQLRKRLEMVNWARSYNSLTFLDSKDDYIQHELSNISGLSQLLETNMWLVAASLEMQGVLFGELKGGLSQETDAMHRYALTIKNRCETYYRPVLQKYLSILYLVNDFHEVPVFEFEMLDKDDENKAKIEGIKSFSELLDALVNSGFLTKFQATVSLKTYVETGNIALGFDELQMGKLEFEEQMEILDFYRKGGKDVPDEILKSQFPRIANPMELSRENIGVPTSGAGYEQEAMTEVQQPTEQVLEQGEQIENETAIEE